MFKIFKKISQFLSSVQFELKKVSWPNWDELRGSTLVVLSLSLMLCIFLFIIDQILSKIVNVVL